MPNCLYIYENFHHLLKCPQHWIWLRFWGISQMLNTESTNRTGILCRRNWRLNYKWVEIIENRSMFSDSNTSWSFEKCPNWPQPWIFASWRLMITNGTTRCEIFVCLFVRVSSMDPSCSSASLGRKRNDNLCQLFFIFNLSTMD